MPISRFLIRSLHGLKLFASLVDLHFGILLTSMSGLESISHVVQVFLHLRVGLDLQEVLGKVNGMFLPQVWTLEMV